MSVTITRVTQIAQTNNELGVVELLKNGMDPNLEGGWPVRLAARLGSYAVVRALIQWGANPHLPGEAGASTLQLAVYSGRHWDDEGSWESLLSCCDSSQLADGAGVAVVFKQHAALRQIIRTGRCNTNVSTTLTGRTVESLAKAYNVDHVIKEEQRSARRKINQCLSPALLDTITASARDERRGPSPQTRSLSPSVARFFEQTAAASALSPQRSPVLIPSGSPLLFGSPASTIRH